MKRAGSSLLLLVALAIAAALAAPAANATTLYTAEGSAPATVSGYAVGANGSLTLLPGAAEDVAVFPRYAVVTPNVRHLYVGGGNLDGFNIEAGSLTPITGSPFGDGVARFGQIAISPDGSRLYSPGQNGDVVRGYDIGPNGELTAVPGSPFAAGTFAWGVAITPDGQHLYVSNSNSDNITAYDIGGNGSLTQIPGSPIATGVGTNPAFMSTTVDGRFLYVAYEDSDQVGAFGIGADGTLTAVPGSPFVAGGSPWGATVSPDSANLYVGAEDTDDVSAYAIAANGALAPVVGSPFSAGDFTRQVAITPDGSLTFAGNNNSDNISRFTRNESTGALAPIAPSIATTDGVTGLAVTPNQPPAAEFNATIVSGRNVAFRSVGVDPEDGAEPTFFSWNFGDGSSTSGPDGGPDHVYTEDGTYEVRLIVGDADGCGPFPIYTGQTMYCNGGPIAVTRKKVTVDTELLGARFKAKRKQRQRGSKVVIRAKAGADEAVDVRVSKAKIKVGGATIGLKKPKVKRAKAGKLAKLKLKVKSEVKRALVHQAIEIGGKPKASFRVTVSDDAGHSASKKLKVVLK